MWDNVCDFGSKEGESRWDFVAVKGGGIWDGVRYVAFEDVDCCCWN